MPIAVHERGPQDGARLRIDEVAQTRFYAPRKERIATGWVTLARYVFVPPRDGAKCVYRYSGQEQVQGPVPGSTKEPDWS